MLQRTRWLLAVVALLALVLAATSVSLAGPLLQSQEEQVSQGQTVYNNECAGCHDPGGAGPELTASVLAAYGNAGDLFNYIKAAMPQDTPGSLSDEQYHDVTAYMISDVGLLPADTVIGPDNAAGISLTGEPVQMEETGAAPAETGEAEAAEAPEAEEATADMTIETVSYAEVVGQQIWQDLQEAEYAANWELAPGKGELYEGAEPHGMLLTTYLNPEAMEALQGQAETMPAGATIVKENYTADEELDSLTVMQKRAGYGEPYAYWAWAKYGPDGAIQASGGVEGCISCHQEASGNDYIYTFTLGEEGN